MAEVRQVREAYAATFDYDLQALFQDIKAQEAESDRTFVSYLKALQYTNHNH